jgi:hypothetical protein
VFLAAAGLGVFLVSEGLSRASLLVTVLGFPLALVGAAAGIWTAVLTAQGLREARQADARRGQEDHTVHGTPPPAPPRTEAPGSVEQHSLTGDNIAHTGKGDINVNRTERRS